MLNGVAATGPISWSSVVCGRGRCAWSTMSDPFRGRECRKARRSYVPRRDNIKAQPSAPSIRHRLQGKPFCAASHLILRWLHRLQALAARMRGLSRSIASADVDLRLTTGRVESMSKTSTQPVSSFMHLGWYLRGAVHSLGTRAYYISISRPLERSPPPRPRPAPLKLEAFNMLGSVILYRKWWRGWWII